VQVGVCHGGTCTEKHICVAAPPPPACGGLGQECCKDPDFYDQTFDLCKDSKTTTCYTWEGSHGTCEACGAAGQAACPGWPGNGCGTGTFESGGWCIACGGLGQPCCGNACTVGTCSPNNTCTLSTQTGVCGQEGSDPCPDDTCSDGLHKAFEVQSGGCYAWNTKKNDEVGKIICTWKCGHMAFVQCPDCVGSLKDCPTSTYENCSKGILQYPQPPCAVPYQGNDFCNGKKWTCYENSMIQESQCQCIPNTVNSCYGQTTGSNAGGLCNPDRGPFIDQLGQACQ
jgi:hypothetical protein